MKGYTYPGTSPMKAKEESVVASTRTQADASLVRMGEVLGDSKVPHAVEYKVEPVTYQPKDKEEKEKKKDKTEQPTSDLDTPWIGSSLAPGVAGVINRGKIMNLKIKRNKKKVNPLVIK